MDVLNDRPTNYKKKLYTDACKFPNTTSLFIPEIFTIEIYFEI